MALPKTHSDCGTSFESGPLQECCFDSILHALNGIKVKVTSGGKLHGQSSLLLSTPGSENLHLLIAAAKPQIPWSQCVLAATLFFGKLLSSSVQSRVAQGLMNPSLIYKDYTVFRICADGRSSLFRAIVVGQKFQHCELDQSYIVMRRLWRWKTTQPEIELMFLEDELRRRALGKLISTRSVMENFIEEGTYDQYVHRMLRTETLGGELEISMAAKFLKTTIRVFMYDKGHAGIFLLAEYGQQYQTEHPINILYRGDSTFDSDSDSELDTELESGSASSICRDYAVFRISEDVMSLFPSIVVGMTFAEWAPKRPVWDLESMPTANEYHRQAGQLCTSVMLRLHKIRKEPWVQGFIEFSLCCKIEGVIIESRELEILMASDVFRTTIRVFMYVEGRRGIFLIAEYGKQFKSEHPINILFRGDSASASTSKMKMEDAELEFSDGRIASNWNPTFEIPVQISVHTIDGTKISLEVQSTNTIDDLKEMIKEKIGTPVNMQMLLYDQNHLENGAATLFQYCILCPCNLYLVRKFVGHFDALSLPART